jgi:hypothetical protein
MDDPTIDLCEVGANNIGDKIEGLMGVGLPQPPSRVCNTLLRWLSSCSSAISLTISLFLPPFFHPPQPSPPQAPTLSKGG